MNRRARRVRTLLLLAAMVVIAAGTFALERTDTVGETYRVAGTGSCSIPADMTENGATGQITIGNFSFKSTTLYPN